ncbi:MAG: hypothetical protein KGL39_51730 [Patescibacteria group bacterium]|nr:hypothetical protein [Patescibacteria group bacterium]
MSDIDELRRLAEGVRRANAEQGYEGSSWRTQAAARTAYEEALSPERILALLDRIEQQEREIERLTRGGQEAENIWVTEFSALRAERNAAEDKCEQLEADLAAAREALRELMGAVQATCEAGHVDFPGIEILGEALEEADAALAAGKEE